MTELRELLPYLIVLILMWNAKQETYFEPYWHLGILDVICVTACYLAWRWFPAKTAAGQRASVSAARL